LQAAFWGATTANVVRETNPMTASAIGAESETTTQRRLRSGILYLGRAELRPGDFVRATSWSTIDIVGSYANTAFVGFALAQDRPLNSEWTLSSCVARYLNGLPYDAYDLIPVDRHPAIGYHSTKVLLGAGVLYLPFEPGHWEQGGTAGFEQSFPVGKPALPKALHDMRFRLTSHEPSDELHRATFQAFGAVFGERVAARPIGQSGRLLASMHEVDHREMTCETWNRAPRPFEGASAEFRDSRIAAWHRIEARENAA
jgi:hypothetical protein